MYVSVLKASVPRVEWWPDNAEDDLDNRAAETRSRAARMIGDFGNARVFVLGAGLLQENAGGKNKDSGVYRNPKTVSLLRQFWETYFTASHAKLVEFGAPALLSPVK